MQFGLAETIYVSPRISWDVAATETKLQILESIQGSFCSTHSYRISHISEVGLCRHDDIEKPAPKIIAVNSRDFDSWELWQFRSQTQTTQLEDVEQMLTQLQFGDVHQKGNHVGEDLRGVLGSRICLTEVLHKINVLVSGIGLGEFSNRPRKLKDRYKAEKQYVDCSSGRLRRATGSKLPKPLTIPALRLMSARKTFKRCTR